MCLILKSKQRWRLSLPLINRGRRMVDFDEVVVFMGQKRRLGVKRSSGAEIDGHTVRFFGVSC